MPLEMEQQQQILSENSLSDEDCIEDIAEANMGQIQYMLAGIKISSSPCMYDDSGSSDTHEEYYEFISNQSIFLT